MPFKPSSLSEQIAAARGIDRSQSIPTSFSGGAAQQAKESSYKWAQAGIQNPQRDSAAPWFSGTQPFSELRVQNAKNFDGWKGRFVNETDMGWKFTPPPPEPSSEPSAPADSFSEDKP